MLSQITNHLITKLLFLCYLASLFLRPFFCGLIFTFSISLLCGHPWLCAYLRLQTELKVPSCASWYQEQQLAAISSTGWQKCHIFYKHFSVSWFFFNTLLFKLRYNEFGVAQFEQQSKWAYVWNHSTINKKLWLWLLDSSRKQNSSAPA